MMQVMQYADRALMEGLKGRCAMLLHPHLTQDSALPLLQQALAMDSDRCATLHLDEHDFLDSALRLRTFVKLLFRCTARS